MSTITPGETSSPCVPWRAVHGSHLSLPEAGCRSSWLFTIYNYVFISQVVCARCVSITSSSEELVLPVYPAGKITPREKDFSSIRVLTGVAGYFTDRSSSIT